MKNLQLYISALLLFVFCISVSAQEGTNPDNYCVNLFAPITPSVKANDIPANNPFSVMLVGPSAQNECFFLDPESGELLWNQMADPERCCGDHTLVYAYQENPDLQDTINITVKCGKPECGLVDLTEFEAADITAGQTKQTIAACEGSLATYFVNFAPTNNYAFLWSYSGESSAMINPSNPSEIDIVWGVPGGGFVSVSVYTSDTSTLLSTYEVCVDILDGPEAAFTAIDSCVCNNAPISFINNSIGGSHYFWEFGDGNTSTAYAPTHQYNTPGTYEVVLTVTSDNFDAEGNPSCCCSDTARMEVVVDSLDGPNVYWISTLCEGDSSKYWTDADCGTFTWSAQDANGVTVPVIPTAFPDTVCVVWPTGPYGTISLQVMACTPALCEKPVHVNVPVIQSVADILGETIVCEGESQTYTLPKWPSVSYMWSVSGGTFDINNQTNSMTIVWGSAGPGTIDVIYGSEFLNGLPNHDGDDCYGMAHLDVDIRPEFFVDPDALVVCVGDPSNPTASPATGFDWSIDPNPGFTVPSGSSNPTITWNTLPGSYTVTVSPTGANPYCNDSIQFVVEVIDIAKPDSISGARSICPEETYTYFPHSTTSSVGYTWFVSGGTVDDVNGNPVMVTWNATGPYQLKLRQFYLNNPQCVSDTICLNVSPKTIDTNISIATTSACVNEVSAYAQITPQDPAAQYCWAVDPEVAGSVYPITGSANVDVQWNDIEMTADLVCKIILCGDTVEHREQIMINRADEPIVQQIGFLCPGVPAQLNVSNGPYMSYAWSHTATNAATVGIVSAGLYTVTVTDFDDCTSLASFEAFNVAGPVAEISTGDPTLYCLPDNLNDVAQIIAQTSGNETYQWYCNGSPQVLPPNQTTLDHTVTAPGDFCYWVDVTDNTTMCISRSDTICIRVLPNCPGPPCEADPNAYSITTTATTGATFCNEVTFTTSGFGFSVVQWNFMDPAGNGFTGPLNNPTHTYSEAGCYLAKVTVQVPGLQGGPPCEIVDTASVCVPVAADFQWTTDCSKYFFQDLSTYLVPDVITAWLWDFGDGDISNLQNPMHEFAPGMNFNVTLTVQTASGCQAVITKTINTYGQPDASFIATPDTVCVGDEIYFTPSGVTAGILYYNWDFGDGTGNGAMDPYHAYTSDDTYTVTLIVEDVNGCMDTFDREVVVHPLPPQDTITYVPSLVICEGFSTILTAPAGAGYMYEWNTGAMVQSITVSTAGVYTVTITDDNDCMMVPDSVEVVVIPFPEPVISGPEIICGNSCITLSVPLGFGYVYTWMDQAGNTIFGPNVDNNKLEVCFPTPFYTEVSVMVEHPNGCSLTSPPHFITSQPNPTFNITLINGNYCEGTPTELMASSGNPNVIFSWGNGVTGNINTYIAAGTYTVTALDTITGCSATQTVTINPMPDMCIVPTGCYEVCDPDTICGPVGMVFYQWEKDGSPVPAPEGNLRCLEVTENGIYTLTAINSFGCSATSDPLILEMIICCDPDDTDVTAKPVVTNGDSCCWTLSYFNSIDSLFGLTIRSDDADVDYIPGSIGGGLALFGSGSNFVSLVNNSAGIPLPTNNLFDFIDICLSNLSVSPAEVFVDWVDQDGMVVCTDTLELECNIEPPCVYIATDSIYCLNDQVFYDFTICNPASNTFAIGYVDIVPVSPAGVTLTPSSLDFSGSPILPGNCRDRTIILGGGNFSNQDFCFNLIAHDFDPTSVDSAECCTADTTYCIQIPGCTMCDQVYVSGVDTADLDECCYTVDITNNFDPLTFTGVDVCALGGSTIQVQNTFSSMWTTMSTAPGEVKLAVNNATGFLPVGTSTLPDICITSSTTAFTDVVIKWTNDGDVLCRDTITLFCPGDCGYMLDSVYCQTDSGWVFQTTIFNTSDEVMDEAVITFTTPGYGVYNQTIPLGGLAPGASFGPIFILIDNAVGNAGDVVCMTVTLHSAGHTSDHESCCNFNHCFVLPDCGNSEPDCLCDDDFEAQVAMGIICAIDPISGIATFTPAGDFSDCDKIIWDFIELQLSQMTVGNQSITQFFEKEGDFTICMTVIRTQPNGKQCKEKFTKEFEMILDGAQGLGSFPNPANSMINLTFRKRAEGMADVQLIDMSGRVVGTWKAEMNGADIQLDVEHLAEGLYHLVVYTGRERLMERVMIFR